MKALFAIATVLILALGVAPGAPVTLAQDDPETAGVTDQGMPPCPPPVDMSLDAIADGDAAPACAPEEGANASNDSNTPAPAPTDPPPTETPRPTDTPQPAVATETATATPSPVPEVPTATPTPTATSGSKDVPAGTLSRQLPFANPGEDECLMQLDISDKQSCKPQTFPAVFTLSFSPYSSTADITVQVDGHKASTTSSITWDFLSVPGDVGPGTHTITASETYAGSPLSAKLSIGVQKASSPHFLVYPRVIGPGSNAKIYLAGFAGSTTLPLGIYRERRDCNTFGQGNECFELVHDLGTIQTNGDGTAIRDFAVPANEKPTAYLVATTGMVISPQKPADSLRTFGRPWFVVGQP